MAAAFITATMAYSANASEKEANNVSESTKTEVSKEISIESSTSAEVATEVNMLLIRLNEIKEMDIASMNAKEKKVLRKEVRSIRKNLKLYSKSNADAKAAAEARATRGIYISTGAAIIIVLLLVLLF